MLQCEVYVALELGAPSLHAMPREDNKELLGLVVTEVDSRVALLCHASAIATDSSTHPEKIFQ